jgi:hypothetical protein
MLSHKGWLIQTACTLFTVFVSLAFTTSGRASAQGRDPNLQQVVSAVVRGDERALIAMMSERIELALLGASRQYSKSQATLVLRQFFQEHPPRAFNIVDSTRSESGVFLEGVLRTRNGDQTYRIYLRLNHAGGEWTLREMLVERAER